MRMLDNVIDINFYPVKKARNANLKHRPVGMGVMGFRIACTPAHPPRLAGRRGICRPFDGSGVLSGLTGRPPSWPKNAAAARRTRAACGIAGILPQDSIDLLAAERGGYLDVDRSESMDCCRSRAAATATHGMRNSTAWPSPPPPPSPTSLACRPASSRTTRTCSSNPTLSGEFTVVNDYLVRDLKAAGLPAGMK